jgi:hypothetical protein
LGLRSKHVNLPASPLTYQMGSNGYLYKNKNHTSVNSFGVSLDLKSREALMPSLAKDDVFFKQPLVRYKPGLMRHWRVHRFFFQKYFSLGSKLRQKRLTRYVSKLANVTSFSFYKAIELSVLHVIRASQFILGLSLGQLQVLLDKVCVYINGIQVYNPYAQIYLGDVLFINMFSISVANFQNNAYLNDVKLKSAVSKLQLHSNFFGLKFTSDNPSYFEIDELTSTLVLLNEPEVGFYESNPPMYRFPHVTFRMYN